MDRNKRKPAFTFIKDYLNKSYQAGIELIIQVEI